VTAILSPCRLYRYRLERELTPRLDTFMSAVAILMLNPSVAAETVDDPTVRRCMGFATAWGFRRLIVGNAYGLRSTDPRGLWASADPVGPDNDAHVEQIARDADLVVCAWGAHAKPGRVAAVLAAIGRAGRTPHALRLTAAGAPGHPLYLPGSLLPFEWAAP
jgi:hypothetical protein